jgi:hypothetical protein
MQAQSGSCGAFLLFLQPRCYIGEGGQRQSPPTLRLGKVPGFRCAGGGWSPAQVWKDLEIWRYLSPPAFETQTVPPVEDFIPFTLFLLQNQLHSAYRWGATRNTSKYAEGNKNMRYDNSRNTVASRKTCLKIWFSSVYDEGNVQDFRLPSWIRWELLSHSEEWQFLTDISEQPIDPIFKGQESKKKTAWFFYLWRWDL